MGLFKNKGKGKLKGFLKKLGVGTGKHPGVKAGLIRGAVIGALNLIPGGAVAAKIAKTVFKTLLPKIKKAAKLSGRIDLDKLRDTARKMGVSLDNQKMAMIAKHLQEETGVPIDNVSATDSIEVADMVRKDPSTLTLTGDNTAYTSKGSWSADNSGNGSGSSSNNSKKGFIERIKDWWNSAPKWQKITVGVGSPMLLLVILGFTLFKGKGRKKFFGKFR